LGLLRSSMRNTYILMDRMEPAYNRASSIRNNPDHCAKEEDGQTTRI
jgi:hypothetical protein